jgi:crotonobetaine/carnitine-CoA ligase
MGRVLDGFAARVVDEDDEEVARGTTGELVVRADESFTFAIVQDNDGWFWFVGRLGDSIRRRGENIAAHDVESVLLSHPAVMAAAVVPVPAEFGEDEVMAFVVPRPGRLIAPESLLKHCEPRLARFAIPRYVNILESLPTTSTGKVERARLRELGVSEDTWDREHRSNRA